jgi:hypothetical protein
LATLHYASGNNIDSQGNFAPAKAGFNLADVSSVDELNALPPGVKGLVWLDQGDGVTQSFIDAVTPYIGNPKVYGFFLKDEPDPTGQWGDFVTAENLKAESDWIHSHVTGAKTFITMMNMGSSDNPSFANTYTPENTHIDLFGIDPYPVRSGSGPIDYNMIDKAVAAAEASGIPTANIVPVFQTFGGGNWVDDQGGHYVMPTAAQEQQMLAHWQAVVPNAAFDYAYSWGSQNGDVSLENSPELQNVFLQHNTSGSAEVVDPPITPPVTDTGSTPDVPDTGVTTPPATDTGGATPPATGGGTTTGSPSAGGSPSDPTTPPTTEAGGGWHNHHHGLDFSQWVGRGSSSWGGHSRDAVTAVATTETVTTAPEATSGSPADAIQWHNFDLSSHSDHHHGWLW